MHPEKLAREDIDKQLSECGWVVQNPRDMPEFNTTGLWDVQVRANTNWEKSLSDNKPRARVQTALGAGKTFTAVSSCYHLIKYGRAKRILFLVDRHNLGKQTLSDFLQSISL